MEQLIDLASLMVAITEDEQLINPNVVKVVTDLKGKALYFSRSTIPFNRDANHLMNCFKHKGYTPFENLRYWLFQSCRWVL